MRCLVTGAAGFVGSHLSERLVELGHDVVGVDCFTPFYDRARKELHLEHLAANPRFRLVEAELATASFTSLLDGVEVVFHQAAQANTRASWGEDFATYTHHNVLATQRLLEAVRQKGTVKRFVYASSSSIYGETLELPMRESTLPRPYSPYGVTKLAAEHLTELYRHNFGLETVSLRYFTVYGPRQRPDMGFSKFIASLLGGQSLTLFGDGLQTRDFTYVGDVVEANVRAALEPRASGIYNIGGGSQVTLTTALETLSAVAGVPLKLEPHPEQPGDVHHTAADTTRARAELGYTPKVTLREGLARQVEYARTKLGLG